MKTIKTLAAALMLTLFAGSMAKAQTPTNDPPAGGLTIEKLADMIDILGLDSEPLKAKDGKIVAYKVYLKHDGKPLKLFVELSPDRKVIWVTANLTELKSEHRAEGSRLFKLLELNDTMGACHFFITNQGKMLSLQLARDNKNVTAKDLRRQLDIVAYFMFKTEDDWNTDKWGTPAPSPMAIPVPVEDMK